MTISELIEQLKKYPSDMRVVIPGYEGGYDDIKHFQEEAIMLNFNDNSYEGVHESAGVCGVADENADETALLIS